MEQELKGNVGRPKEWDPSSPKGKLLLKTLKSVDTYREATDAINAILGTNYDREGIKSAAYRYGYQLTKLDETLTRTEQINQQYGIVDEDDIPILSISDDRLWVPLWFTSDWHYGHSLFNQQLFEHHAAQAIELGAYMFNGGDALETAVPTHMPQTMWSQASTPQSQADWLEKVYQLLRHGVSTPGNHEGRIRNLTSLCPMRTACDAAGALYRKYGGPMVIRFDSGVEYEIVQKHGGSFGKNSEKEVKEWGDIYRDADIVALGHDHRLWAKTINEHFKTINLPDGKRKRVQFSQLGLRTGHFMKYGGYVETRPYTPNDPGSAMVWVNTQNREIKWEVVSHGTFMDFNRTA